MRGDEYKELMELTRENNEMLHSLRRSQKLSYIGRAVYWILILVIVYGSFVWIKPFLGKIQQAYNVILEQTTAAQSSLVDLNDVRKDLRDGEIREGVSGLFDLFGKEDE
jgi:hypothetical protein